MRIPVHRFALLVLTQCFYNELLINKYRSCCLSVILSHIDLRVALYKFSGEFTFVSLKVKIGRRYRSRRLHYLECESF